MEKNIEDLRGATAVFYVMTLSFMFLSIQALSKHINNWWTIAFFIGFFLSAALFLKKHKKAPFSSKMMIITTVGNAVMWSIITILVK